MNRLFTKAQKRHLYIAAGGKCQQCGEHLGESWDAHHMIRYADGGVTEIPNGAALCRECHKEIHRRTSMSVIKPRGWQENALTAYRINDSKAFLLEATPGAGKTIFSALCMKDSLDAGEVDFVVIVVPTTALKGDGDAGFLGDWHKVGVHLTPVLKDGAGAPKDFQAGVVTYQQLPNIISTFETWARSGSRLGFVFDEVHHASDTNVWGAAAGRCGEIASRILSMTGTPFRGDGRPIAFVNYDESGQVIPDHKYGYAQAVRDQVCRPVLFQHDNGVAEYILNGEIYSDRIEDATPENESRIAATIFQKESKWLETVITNADAKLDEYRISDVNAGGIVICRPGADESDDRHLHQVAEVVRRVSGERPVIITHDDPDANAKIEAFRKSSDKWICAVRKISEGVDIKRLRTMVMATKPGTQLLFRQMVGRVVRWEDRTQSEDATIYMAGFPQLKEWAAQIEREAQEGLKQKRERDAGERPEREPGESSFSPVGATHEAGGATASFGEQFTAQEIMYAEQIKRGDPVLSGISVAAIAHLNRKQGRVPEPDYAGPPKHQVKMEKRTAINTLARRVAIKASPDNPNFKAVWMHIHKVAGIRNINDLMDNYDLAKMEEVESLLKSMLAGGMSHVA